MRKCISMAAAPLWVDLRGIPERQQPVALIEHLSELAPGEVLELRAPESPERLLQCVNVQLMAALAWEIEAVGEAWTARIRRVDDTVREPSAGDALDLLRQDHRRLDEMLGGALRQIKEGDVAGAAPQLKGFARGLRRHLHAEDELVVHALAGGPSPDLETMLCEHGELLEQLAAVESALRDAPAGAPPAAGAVEPGVGLLAETLAQHEHREETTVFPAWAARYAELADDAAEALRDQVRDVLHAP